MKARFAQTVLPLGLAAMALAAGCGGDDSSSSASEPASSASNGGAATVAVADNPELGQILVDGEGRTLYLFEKDQSNQSRCSGACAKVWPPYTTTGDPEAGDAKGNELDQFGAEWYALRPSGEKAEGDESGGGAGSAPGSEGTGNSYY